MVVQGLMVEHGMSQRRACQGQQGAVDEQGHQVRQQHQPVQAAPLAWPQIRAGPAPRQRPEQQGRQHRQIEGDQGE